MTTQTFSRVVIHVSKAAVPMHYDAVAHEGPWDPAAAVLRLRSWSGVDSPGADLGNFLRFRDAFASADESRQRDLAAYLLPHHDLVEHDGWPRLMLSRQGLLAAAAGVESVPEPDREAAKAHLADHFHGLGLPAPWEGQAGPQAPELVAGAAIGKPFTTEHRARQTDPGKYKRFARKELAPGVSAILGVGEDGKSEVQSVAFDASKFSAAEAKAWLGDHGFNSGNFEEATEKVAKIVCFSEGTEKRLVLAVAMRPGDVDTHGDRTARDEVQAAMHRFAIRGGVGARQNVNHQPEEQDVYVVESAMAAADFAEWDGAKLAEAIKRDDWYIVLKVVSDELWARKDEFTGVSIEGYGLRAPAEPAPAAAPPA